MAEGRAEFEAQLRALGHSPDDRSDGRTSFLYTVGAGSFAGERIRLGLEAPPDFPRTPPGGIHMSPRILPINPGAPAHPERVAESPFGPEWEYWSRPMPQWPRTDRTVKAYLAYLESLFALA